MVSGSPPDSIDKHSASGSVEAPVNEKVGTGAEHAETAGEGAGKPKKTTMFDDNLTAALKESQFNGPGADKNEKLAGGKREITEEECYSELGFSWPTWKKWTILTVSLI